MVFNLEDLSTPSTSSSTRDKAYEGLYSAIVDPAWVEPKTHIDSYETMVDMRERLNAEMIVLDGTDMDDDLTRTDGHFFSWLNFQSRREDRASDLPPPKQATSQGGGTPAYSPLPALNIPIPHHHQIAVRTLEGLIEEEILPNGLDPCMRGADAEEQAQFLRNIFSSRNPHALDGWMVKDARGSYSDMEFSNFYISIWGAMAVWSDYTFVEGKTRRQGPVWRTEDLEIANNFCSSDRTSKFVHHIFLTHHTLDVELYHVLDDVTLGEIVAEVREQRERYGLGYHHHRRSSSGNQGSWEISLSARGDVEGLPLLPGSLLLTKHVVAIVKTIPASLFQRVLGQGPAGAGDALAYDCSTWAYSGALLHAVAAYKGGSAGNMQMLSPCRGLEGLIGLVKTGFRLRMQIILAVMDRLETEPFWSELGLLYLEEESEDVQITISSQAVTSRKNFDDRYAAVISKLKSLSNTGLPTGPESLPDPMEVDQSDDRGEPSQDDYSEVQNVASPSTSSLPSHLLNPQPPSDADVEDKSSNDDDEGARIVLAAKEVPIFALPPGAHHVSQAHPPGSLVQGQLDANVFSVLQSD